MKNKWSIGLAIIVLIGVVIYQYKKYRVVPAIDFPSLQLSNLQGKDVDWNEVNKPVFIQFFATWCIDCKKEMPQIVLLSSQLQHQGVQTLLISDEPIETLQQYQQNTALPLTIYHSKQALSQIGINTYPSTVIINKEGKKIYSATNVQDWANPDFVKNMIHKIAP